MAIDWIEEEAERIRSEKLRQEERSLQMREVQNEISDRWNQIKDSFREQIAEFNNNQVIQDRYKRKLEIEDDGWSELRIKSVTFPAIYMTIKRNGHELALEWTVVTPTHLERWSQNASANMDHIETEDFFENLKLLATPDELIFDGPSGRSNFSELPQYILRKFLVDPTIFPRRG